MNAAVTAQPKSPRRIQADGGGSGICAAVLVRRAQQTFDATASVAQSIMAQVSAFALCLCGYTRRPHRYRIRLHTFGR
jgi:hypothetical protein